MSVVLAETTQLGRLFHILTTLLERVAQLSQLSAIAELLVLIGSVSYTHLTLPTNREV